MNNSQITKRGQQAAQSGCGNECKAKGIPTHGCNQIVSHRTIQSRNQGLPICGTTKTLHENQPKAIERDRNSQKSKATYSAQYQANKEQSFNVNNSCPLNIPNMETPGGCYCNVAPVYNVSGRMMANGQHVSAENARHSNNMQCPCPYCNVPPPMPPCEDDLWDLQFCRWWGWNWIRKREEMMNQKKTEMIPKRATSSETRKKKPRKRRKQDDFFSWCNKVFKGRPKQKQLLKDDEKQQLQELYDTPCSSVTLSKCPCPLDDWECRSLNLTGEYECYRGSKRQTSMSTVIVQNNTRHQRCKQSMRKRQSWVYEKTDSSSSEELHPCTCVCPQRNESSTEESVEYLSMRMAQIKSDGEDNPECCTCMKQKKPKNNVCCPCKMRKKHETKICCPCMIKLVYKKPSNSSCNKLPEQKCSMEKCGQCRCYRSPAPCLPVCRSPRPHRVPQFRRLPPSGRHPEPLINNYLECRIRPKRKYVCCPCEEPRKKIRVLRKPKEIYCYCCCCNNCCCGNKKDVLAENQKASKSEELLKETADKCIGSKSMVENLNVLDSNLTSCNNNGQTQCYGMFTQVNDANFCSNFPIGDGIHGKAYNNGQFGVSTALQQGSYTSPVTGRLYSLNPKIFTVNQVLPQSTLPEPLDVNKKVFNINSTQPSGVDEEHKLLLSAVCEAIMSSRASNKQHRQPPKTQYPPSNKRRNQWYHARPPIYKRPRNYSHYFTNEKYCGSDNTRNSTPTIELEELNSKTFTVSHAGLPKVSNPFDYKILLSPSNAKLPLPNFELPQNFKFNVENLPNQRSISDMSGKSRYFIAPGQHGPLRQRCPVEAQNYTTQQFHNLKLINSDTTPLQITTNAPPFEEKYSQNSLPTTNSWEEFSTANIFETCNKETCFNASLQNYYIDRSTIPLNSPTIQKSSTDNFGGESGDSTGDVPVSPKNLTKEKKETLIPFNSPRNWIKPPKLTGISMTGLFSTVGNVKRLTKSCKGNKKKVSRYKTEQLKKQRLYNSLFSTRHPGYSEGFSNLPYNFSPVPNSQSMARNPTIYPSLVLHELPSGAVQTTQTSTVCNDRSHYCTCKNDECQNQTEKEIGCRGLMKETDLQSRSTQAACSKVTRPTNTMNSQPLQTNCPDTKENPCVTSQEGALTTAPIYRQTQTAAARTAKASNTIHSVFGVGISKPTDTCDIHCKNQTDNPITTQTSYVCKPLEPYLFIPPQERKTEPSRNTASRTTETSNLNSKSSGITYTKSTEISNHDQTKQSTASILFTEECHSEKEIGCRYFNEASSKNFQSTSAGPATNANSLQFPFEKNVNENAGGICVYLQHKQQGVDCFTNTDVNLQSSEKFLAIVNGLSEKHLVNESLPPSNVPLAPSNVPLVPGNIPFVPSNVPLAPSDVPIQEMPTTSKRIDRSSPKMYKHSSFPKAFVSGIPTPIYMNTTTSPFKFKYATTRTKERSFTENFGKEKVPKRESPFSMFCSPVTSKGAERNPSSNNEVTETGSLSRPDRQVVLAKPKKLKTREKRWRY